MAGGLQGCENSTSSTDALSTSLAGRWAQITHLLHLAENCTTWELTLEATGPSVAGPLRAGIQRLVRGHEKEGVLTNPRGIP